MITIYTTSTCPKCKIIIDQCKKHGVEFREKSIIDMSSHERADCICSLGYMPMEAPLIFIDNYNHWYHELFNTDGTLNSNWKAIIDDR